MMSVFVLTAITSVQLLKHDSQSLSPSKGSSATTLHSYPETRLKVDQTKKERTVILDRCSESREKGCEDEISDGKLTQARFKKMPWMKYSERHSVLVRETNYILIGKARLYSHCFSV